ncbi:hypothetical protein QFZ42_003352 [Variovorax paradoxus]|uniref:hypothetical protein n=1 Tax=Variovorax paradoxus TaxID=34073 RepID=UPI00279468FC|nr:hypothetical protein [Variovorax paradoxus]MDQ0571518.1 hypothetical protein [Variovorax paradoxus]
MKALGIKENFRVVAEPRDLGDFGYVRAGLGLVYGRGPEAQKQIERDWQDRCDEIAKDIKRHVDAVASVGVEFDQLHVCSHCGASWTEVSAEYNGGCCEADENAQLEREKVAA